MIRNVAQLPGSGAGNIDDGRMDMASHGATAHALTRLARTAALVGLFTAAWGAQEARAANCSPTGVVITDNLMGGAFIFYDDNTDTTKTNAYIGYTITNNAASTSSDLWVKLDGFGAGRIQLGTNESGVAHVGPLAAGASAQVYFYLRDTTPSAGDNAALNQNFFVNLFPTDPALNPTEICDYQDTVSQVDATVNANPNQVHASVTGPNPPELGGVVTITVVGQTGTMGGTQRFSANPASDDAWRADAFKLFDTQIEFWAASSGCPGGGAVPVGSPTNIYTDVLVFNSPTPTNSCYRTTFSFWAVGSTTAPTAVLPVNYIESGGQMKYTGSYPASIPPIQPANNFATLTKSGTPTKLPNAGNVAYTVTITNGGTIPIRIDKIVDAMPASPANASYVAGSSTFNGAAITDPTVSGQTVSWTGDFAVPAGGTRTLTYTLSLPSTQGTYTNSVKSFVGPTQIDTTAAVTDNAPATVNVIMGNANMGVTGTDSPDPVEINSTLTYTLTVTNAGPDDATNAVATLTLPAGVVYLNAVASGWTCSESGGVVTCTRAAFTSGSSTDITVTATSPATTGSISATAAVSSDLGDSDSANDSATFSTNVVQTPAPPTVLTPANGSSGTDRRPTISGTSEANVTIDVIVDSSSIGTTTSDGSGNWSFTPSSDLSLGNHNVTATATRGAATSLQGNTNAFAIIGCGDAVLQAGEGCDDGNAANGDGCNSSCLKETGFACNATAPGLIADPSCATGICDLTNGPTGTCEVSGCGDNHLQAGEGCDDGNTTNGDGCNSSCLKETGFACNATAPGLIADPSCATGICDLTNGPTGTCEVAGCGDNHLQSGEGCDDGNTANGDGCNSTCLKETGFACNATAPGLIADPSCATGICDL
ncbi:MAG: Ig-like domain-containing protein, partial [Myxococcota bacterium]